MQPGLAFLVRWLENENYWGDMVYDPNAPLVERVRQTTKAAQKDLGTPLSYRAYEESKRRSDAGYGQAVRSFFGITPAPREFQRTPAQNQIREYLNRRGQRALTPEQAERAETRRPRDSETTAGGAHGLAPAGRSDPRPSTGHSAPRTG